MGTPRSPVGPRPGAGSPPGLRTLVVEDEELAVQAHADYVRRTAGFALVGAVRSARSALRELRTAADAGAPVELLLLDMNLPDGHGLALLRTIRAEGHLCDVVAVTAARDLDVVQQAVAQGVVLYLLKPFTYAGFRSKLEQYAGYRVRLRASEGAVGQDEVDRLLGSLRGAPQRASVPKGMSVDTLREVTLALGDGVGRSASELATTIGASRVTARRYLEYLASERVVERSVRYGGSGRPEVEYRWTGA
ncbi:MAG: response regulator [Nocardioidaceae bacterium]